MVSLSLDFVLPSCPGIPESMWIATSSIIGVVIKRCWLLLGPFITIRLLADAIVDVTQGHFTLIPYGKTLLHAFFVASFLLYYKPLLMFFDGFIERLCDVEKLVLTTALEQGKDRFPDYLKNQSWFSALSTFVKGMLEVLPKMLFILTHTGAIHAMHYLKAVMLLVITAVGPLAALFSILPGHFKKGWGGWTHSYVHVTCWTITLNIFRVLVKAFTAVSLLMEPRSVSTFFSESIGHAVLSLILFIAIFLTPVWTSKFMGTTVTAPLVSTVGILLAKLGMMTGNRGTHGPTHSK